MCIYGYARISRPQQSIDRQVRNIHEAYPNAIVLTEAYTGRSMNRPEWKKLFKKVKSGDTVVFDSVSRMSRDTEEGVTTYFELFERGVNLVFLKEHHIDTDTYRQSLSTAIEMTGDEIADLYIEATNKVFRILAERQIRLAFEQSEKEVEDLRQRTREGIETARLNGKQIGQKSGNTFTIKKKDPIIAIIRDKSKDFNGTMTDAEVMAILASKTVSVPKDKKGTLKQVSAKVSRNTYYKYKKEAAEM